MTTILIYAYLFTFWVEQALHFSLTRIPGLSLLNLITYLFLVVWAFNAALKKKIHEPNNVNKYLLLMVIVALVSIPLKIWHGEIPTMRGRITGELIYLKNWADPFIIFFILYNMIDDEKTCRNTLLGLVAFLFITALSTPMVSLGLFKVTKFTAFYQGRAGGFTEPNQYASFLVLFIPLVMTYFLYSKHLIHKIVNGVFLLVCFIALVITGSRGGALSLCLGIAVYLLFLRRERLMGAPAIALAIMALFYVGVFAFLLSPSQVKKTVAQRFDLTDSEMVDEITSGHGRFIIWQNGMQMFLERPILGHGQNTFASLNRANFGSKFTAHNVFLNYMVQFGAVGLIVFIIILVRIFQHVYYNLSVTTHLWRKKLYLSYIAGLLGYTFSMINVDIVDPRTLFWIYTAAMYRYIQLDIGK